MVIKLLTMWRSWKYWNNGSVTERLNFCKCSRIGDKFPVIPAFLDTLALQLAAAVDIADLLRTNSGVEVRFTTVEAIDEVEHVAEKLFEREMLRKFWRELLLDVEELLWDICDCLVAGTGLSRQTDSTISPFKNKKSYYKK